MIVFSDQLHVVVATPPAIRPLHVQVPLRSGEFTAHVCLWIQSKREDDGIVRSIGNSRFRVGTCGGIGLIPVMDVVDAIAQVQTATRMGMTDVPVQPVIIQKAYVQAN